MSKHPSYGKVAKTGKKRNVFKRFERVRLMQSREQWEDRTSVLHLPKTKVST